MVCHDAIGYALNPSRSERAEFSGLEFPGCIPSLPAGYEAHTIWSFRDDSDGFHYEFNLVYGPSKRSAASGPARRLDEDLSYWSVAWSILDGAHDEHLLGRSVTFAQLREKHGSRLTFRQFSSLFEMRSELFDLLHPGDLGRR